MRRRDREVSDPAKIREIIAACHCCRLGFADGGKIYIVPLNFGYQEEDGQRTFFFHSAPEGRKIDLIEKTHCAGFELDTHYQLNSADTACAHSARFQSVIGSGRVEFVREPQKWRLCAASCGTIRAARIGRFLRRPLKAWPFSAWMWRKSAPRNTPDASRA